MKLSRVHLAAFAIVFAGTAAPAQLPGLGGVLPNLGSVGVGNAAGVLGYCLKRKLLGGANASSVLGKLTGQSGVKSSPGYGEGQKGILQMQGSRLSLDSLKSKAKTKACNMVLKHAQTML